MPGLTGSGAKAHYLGTLLHQAHLLSFGTCMGARVPCWFVHSVPGAHMGMACHLGDTVEARRLQTCSADTFDPMTRSKLLYGFHGSYMLLFYKTITRWIISSMVLSMKLIRKVCMNGEESI